MMFNRIGISIGHIGKPNKPSDHGATIITSNKDGATFFRAESAIALKYGTQLYHALRKKGKEAFLICDGEYRDRLSRADGMKLDLILHCHVNAGGGNYSLTEHSTLAGAKTKITAQTIADNLGQVLGLHRKVMAVGVSGRGYSLLEPVKASSIIIEPFFIDSARFKDWIKHDTDYINVIVSAILQAII